MLVRVWSGPELNAALGLQCTSDYCLEQSYVSCYACHVHVMPALCILSACSMYLVVPAPLSHFLTLFVYKSYFSETFLVFVFACNIHCLRLNRIVLFPELAATFTLVAENVVNCKERGWQNIISAYRNRLLVET